MQFFLIGLESFLSLTLRYFWTMKSNLFTPSLLWLNLIILLILAQTVSESNNYSVLTISWTQLWVRAEHRAVAVAVFWSYSGMTLTFRFQDSVLCLHFLLGASNNFVTLVAAPPRPVMCQLAKCGFMCVYTRSLIIILLSPRHPAHLLVWWSPARGRDSSVHVKFDPQHHHHHITIGNFHKASVSERHRPASSQKFCPETSWMQNRAWNEGYPKVREG